MKKVSFRCVLLPGKHFVALAAILAGMDLNAAETGLSSDGSLRLHEKTEDAPAWTVRYGQEFWQRPASAPEPTLAPQQRGSPRAGEFSIGNVIERVSHAWRVNASRAGLEVKARTYTAGFVGGRVTFAPLRHKTNATTTIRTIAIRRGGQTLYAAGGPKPEWSFLGNTAQALLSLKYSLVQHIEARSEGLAITWVVAKRLPGEGTLVIEAELAGLAHSGQSSSGHHFGDDRGGSGLRVGNVTVVDAAGKRWSVPTRANGNSVSITVPESIMSQAIYPLAIDPIISPEFGMDQAVLVSAPASEHNPAIASNGTNYLVAWVDDREVPRRFYAARVSKAGVVLDPGGIALGEAVYVEISVGSNGKDYLVVWQSREPDIHAARISSDGILLDPNPIIVAAGAGNQEYPEVSSDGTNYLVAWVEDSSGIRARRVRNDATILDSSSINISASGLRPTLAFNGTQYLIAWIGSNQDIYATRVSTGGLVANPNGLPVSARASAETLPAVGSDGTNFLVAWYDSRNNGPDVYAARVGNSGVVLDPNGIAVTSVGGVGVGPFSVAFNGADYLIAWGQSGAGSDIRAGRVTTSGVLRDTNSLVISSAPNGQALPQVASSGSEFLVVWQDFTLSGNLSHIYGARVTAQGQVLDSDGINISGRLEPNRQHAPSIAFNGSDYLVVWADLRNFDFSGVDIYGVRVTQNGTVLDPNGIGICTATGEQGSHAIAANQETWFVVWRDLRGYPSDIDIYGARVMESGLVLDTNGIRLSMSAGFEGAPAVAGNGSEYLVVWSGGDIRGTRVTSTGTVRDTNGIPIATAIESVNSAAVASDGRDYLVVWGDSSREILGKRVSGDGGVLDLSSIAISGLGGAKWPAIASNGTNYLVAWEDGRNFSVNSYDIYGARVTPTGALLDPGGIPICTDTNRQNNDAAVASDGSDYFVVWADWRGGATTGVDVYGARVTSGGIVVDTNGFALNTGTSSEWYPAIADGCDGSFLLVSEGTRNGVARMVGNIVSFPGVEKPLRVSRPADLNVRIRPDPAAATTTNATFCVHAKTCDPPLSYQWQFNGADIPGAVEACLTITNVQLADEGNYRVMVRDGRALAASAEARLTPIIGIAITQWPVNQSVAPGGNVTFSAAIIGNPPPFRYEWRRVSTPLATNVSDDRIDFFTLNNVRATEAGSYRLLVRNAFNTVGVLGFANLTVLADADTDGLPDDWETANSLNSTNAADAVVDSDGDGVNNLQEYIAGTGPQDTNSYLRVERIAASGSATLWFQAASNKTYTVQYSDTVETGAWSKLTDVIARATNRVEQVVDPASAVARLYRLVTPRQP